MALSSLTFLALRMGHVNLWEPRGLPVQYELVDSIVWHDAEDFTHSQTDSGILDHLRCKQLHNPIFEVSISSDSEE